MKTYRAAEVAKMLKVSEGSIYEMVKKGKLQKVNGLGRSVRITEDELKRLKGEEVLTTLPVDPEKADLIETFLGKVRKLKNQDWYVLRDLAALLGRATHNIKIRVSEKNISFLNFEESTANGIPTNASGTLLINLTGIKEYASRSKSQISWSRLIKELTQPNLGLSEEEAFETKSMTTVTPIEQGVWVFGNNSFGKLRVLGREGDFWFIGKEVALILGYKDTSDALKKHVDTDEKMTLQIADSLGRLQNTSVISESGLYSLIFGSKLEKAKQFKKWVTSEILPAIRQTGGYVVQGREESFIGNYLDSFSPEVKQLMVQDLKKNRQQLRAKLEAADKLLSEIEEA